MRRDENRAVVFVKYMSAGCVDVKSVGVGCARVGWVYEFGLGDVLSSAAAMARVNGPVHPPFLQVQISVFISITQGLLGLLLQT